MGTITRTELIYLIFVLLLKLTLSSQIDCSTSYGRSCPYLPAPSGKTPLCARPGQTFCEHPDNYPRELIMFLATQARYNYRSLVIDETRDEYHAATGPYPAAKYPVSHKEIDITTTNPYRQDQYYWQNRDPANYPYTSDNGNFTGNVFDGFDDHPDGSVSQSGGQFLRDVRRFMHERVKRSELLRRQMKEIRESPLKKNFTGQVKYKRIKRQNGELTGEELCQARTNFIMPRAAMNKDGNWMFIVNIEESPQKLTQLVRSEVCASQTCSSICGLPNGYTSRCEQKYIQKRLVALQGQGDQLAPDAFWIPSCCVCTIQRN